jgi:hypothetical protein
VAARNLTDGVDGFLIGKRYLLHDRDPLFTDEFRGVLDPRVPMGGSHARTATYLLTSASSRSNVEVRGLPGY